MLLIFNFYKTYNKFDACLIHISPLFFHVGTYRDIYMKNTIIIFIKIIGLVFTFNKCAYSFLTSLSIFRDIHAQDKNPRLISELNQRKEL